uniref:Uncharacterized protein n=1 Tax=Rhizophora mucronata TaxID=61149 RepID=A0A2P2Q295_RHIMU
MCDDMTYTGAHNTFISVNI